MTWIPTLMSGDEIYRNFHEGPGTQRLAASAKFANAVASRYQERVDRLLHLRTRMEAAWQGAAGDAARRGLGPLAIEHEVAGRALHVAQDLTCRQVGSFDEAKNAVVPVPPTPGEVDPLAILVNPEVASTHLRQVAQHNQAAQHNVDIMAGYAGVSQYNTDGQPTSYGRLTTGLPGVAIDTSPGIEVAHGEIRSNVDGQPVRGQDSVPRPEAGGGDSPEGGQGVDPVPNVPFPPGVDPVAESTRQAATVSTSTAPTSTVPAGGLGIPVTGDAAPDGGPRGGGAIGGGAHGGGVLPRGDVPAGGLLGGGGASSGRGTQPGIAARPMVISAGPGRGGVGFAGLPPIAGKGRGDEDTERRTPGYLDGGDPEELWDTDELTAPPAIGDEDG